MRELTSYFFLVTTQPSPPTPLPRCGRGGFSEKSLGAQVLPSPTLRERGGFREKSGGAGSPLSRSVGEGSGVRVA